MANTRRRSLLKRLIDGLARDGAVEVRYKGHSGNRVFILRAGNGADYSVASEFFRGGYRFPNFQPKHIVDGGANIGLFSVTAADRFQRAQIDCYEPSRENVALLCRNLARNGVSADVRQAALWAREEKLRFVEVKSYSGTVSPAAEVAAGCEVQAVLPEIKEDCWLKLDIEGAEYELLPALFAAGRFPRWISAELHHYRDKGPRLVALLGERGYAVSNVPANQNSELANIYAIRK